MPQPPTSSKMNILTLTDVTGAQVLVNADQICTIHPLPSGGSKIVLAPSLSIEVRETPHVIKEVLP